MKSAADVIEDVEFLNDTLIGAIEAARRTGFTSPHALEKWLERHDRYDLWQALKHRDPEGAHPSGSDRKKRLMSVETTDPIAALLDRAARSTQARTRNRAAKAQSLITDLRAALEREAEDQQRQSAARKEIERLERELAAARARLHGGSGGTTLDVDGSVSASELRQWAAANDIACPPMGRVPRIVREAYDAAQDEPEAATA